jgi:hypothetical protein
MIDDEDVPDDEDMECPFEVPDGFQISPKIPDKNALAVEKDNSQADALS